MNWIPKELRLKAILYILLILSNCLSVIVRPQHGFPEKACRYLHLSSPRGSP